MIWNAWQLMSRANSLAGIIERKSTEGLKSLRCLHLMRQPVPRARAKEMSQRCSCKVLPGISASITHLPSTTRAAGSSLFPVHQLDCFLPKILKSYNTQLAILHTEINNKLNPTVTTSASLPKLQVLHWSSLWEISSTWNCKVESKTSSFPISTAVAFIHILQL